MSVDYSKTNICKAMGIYALSRPQLKYAWFKTFVLHLGFQ